METNHGRARKVIITCAVTGAIHTPSMSPHLPVTAEEIADAAIGAAEAGAAIVHLHARDPVTGRPDQTPEAFAPFLQVIKQRSDCVINLTTGGAPYMTIEERVRPAATFRPEVASLNMGSMNFGLFPMLNRFKEFKHDWERQALENSRNLVFKNTFQDIEYILRTCAENGTRFEFECYDTSHLYNLAHFLDRGLVQTPLFVQTVFGILGGIGPHPEDVLHMKRTADRLFGTSYRWSVLGAGRNQMPVAAMAAAMGGNVRVGLEDSLWDGPGRLAESNAAQVKRARLILEGLGLEVASPAEAREILSLKGGRRGGLLSSAGDDHLLRQDGTQVQGAEPMSELNEGAVCGADGCVPETAVGNRRSRRQRRSRASSTSRSSRTRSVRGATSASGASRRRWQGCRMTSRSTSIGVHSS